VASELGSIELRDDHVVTAAEEHKGEGRRFQRQVPDALTLPTASLPAASLSSR
jgi:hypothetical protein